MLLRCEVQVTVFWQTETTNLVPQILLEGWRDVIELSQNDSPIWTRGRSPPFCGRSDLGRILGWLSWFLDQIFKSNQSISKGTQCPLDLLELGTNLLQKIYKSTLYLLRNHRLQLIFRNWRRSFPGCIIWSIFLGWILWSVFPRTVHHWFVTAIFSFSGWLRLLSPEDCVLENAMVACKFLIPLPLPSHQDLWRQRSNQ